MGSVACWCLSEKEGAEGAQYAGPHRAQCLWALLGHAASPVSPLLVPGIGWKTNVPFCTVPLSVDFI